MPQGRRQETKNEMPPSTPLWVKVFGVIFLVLVLLVIILHLTGNSFGSLHGATQEGVANYFLAPIIQQKPLVELQAISAYLSRQRNVHDRPRLFTWLVCHDFGAQLLGQQKRCKNALIPRARQDAALPDAVNQIPEGAVTETSYSTHASGPQIGCDAHLVTTWASVLAELQRTIPPRDFATWLSDTKLLALEKSAVVGAPNVFARDKLKTTYGDVVRDALHLVTNDGLPVQFVIDGG